MSTCQTQPCNPVFSIFLGDAVTLPLKALYAGTLDPLDLTACTEILVNLPNQDGTFTVRKLSLGQVVIVSPAVLGKFTTAISSVISAALNVGELQNLDVTFTIASSVFTVRFASCFSVFQVD